MNEKYNSICICRDNYKDEYDMWADISDFLRILIQNSQEVKFYCDEPGLGHYVIEYNYTDAGLGGSSLEWLGDNEYVAQYNTQEGDN